MTAWSVGSYLTSFLAPLAPYLARSDVTDLYVNRPGELWLEYRTGQTERIANPELTTQALSRLVRQVAAGSSQGINRENPLLAASLPDGSRIQIVLPPATRGDIAIAIRKHGAASPTLEDYERSGAFMKTKSAYSSDPPKSGVTRNQLTQKEALKEAVRSRKNIMISGGTSTGKTTFLNALLQEVPRDERLIFIEDAAELRIDNPNAVGLVAARGNLGEASVTVEDLLVAALRMRPDRIILGELRGKEASTFLRAVNTGHPGSITTIHADSPDRAVDQLALLVLQGGSQMSWDNVAAYARRSIDVFVQLRREDGIRFVETVVT